MTTTTETIATDDRAAAATTATAPAAPRTSATAAAAAHTAPESTDRGLGDTPGGALVPALALRAPDQTPRRHRTSRRSLGTDTRARTLAPPPGRAHGRAPGPAVNLEAADAVEVIFKTNVSSW